MMIRIAALLFLTVGNASAQQTSQLPAQSAQQPAQVAPHADAPVVQAVRISQGIRVDGRLDEAEWQGAVPATELFQLDPQEGAPVSERTEIRVLFDDEAIYIGARMHDTGEVRTRLGRRDMPLGDSDWLTVIFDTYHDHRSASGFEINPSGVRRDQTRSGGREDDSWDPVWEGASTMDEGGWSAELRIPFSQLRFNRSEAENAVQTWGIQLERTIARKREFAQFSFTPRTQPGGIPRYGHLHGLASLRTGKRLEVLPYTVARAEYIDPRGNPFRQEGEADAAFGVDLKYRVTSDLTLDATINPDFGQVEVDPAEVNLTAIETRFQEKRPFFIEGAELFDFGNAAGNSVFYSRRIGRRPQVGVRAFEQDMPDAARIIGAAKLTGRTRNGWSIGVLDAVTERAEARYRVDDQLLTSDVEPTTNYFIGRARRELGSATSTIGGMFTAVNRDLSDDRLAARLHESAYTGGLDFLHEWAGRTWSARGFLSGSYVTGDRRAITATQIEAPWHYYARPDADHLELDTAATSLAGVAGQLRLSRRVGRHWGANVDLATITPGYEVNDIGFQYRADRIDGQADLSYTETRPGDVLRFWQSRVSARHERNYDWQNIQTMLTAAGNAQLLSYWSGNIFVLHLLESIDVRLTRGGPAALRPAMTMVAAGVNSDARKPYVGGIGGRFSSDAGGGWTHSLNLQLDIKPAASWNLQLQPMWMKTQIPAQYLGEIADQTATRTYGRRYLFAELDQTVVAMETRLNLTFRPGLSFQLFAQPFLTGGDYAGPAELAAGHTFDFLVYGQDIGEVEAITGGTRVYPMGRTGAAKPFVVRNRDFNVRSLRGNAVLRWEWRQGSTLYVAWQQMREDFEARGDFDFSRDRAAMFHAAPDNIFMVKVNYWLNP